MNALGALEHESGGGAALFFLEDPELSCEFSK